MKQRHRRQLAGLTAALGGALVIGWLARDRFTPPARDAQTPAAASPASARFIPPALPAPPPALRPGLDAALAALLRAIARGEAREHEALLTFKDDEALRRFLDRLGATGLALTGRIDALRSIRVRFEDPAALGRALRQAEIDPAGVGANFLFELPHPPAREARPATTQVPFGNLALATIGAAGDRSAWGRGITIAILDTGIASDPTFGQGRVYALDIGHGTTPGHGEEDGHGTAVAALAAGAAPDAPGVAPAARLLSIRVTDADAISDVFTLAQGIVAATNSGARIINVSLGGYATGAALDGAIGYALEHGALVVAAAGNDQATQLAWPAADARVISVGAVDRIEQQVLFSNSGAQLKLTAPGYGVQTAWLDAERVAVDGTSASAPFVAGALATVLSLDPNLTAAQAGNLLFRTANDAGQPGVDSAFGHGIVNLATALNERNPSYVDTAVSSQFYDEASRTMQFVVQNRSGRTVNGLTLNVDAWGSKSQHAVPSLDAGATQIVAVPVAVKDSTLQTAGRLVTSSHLVNPPGVVDAEPANNQRTSVLTAPALPEP